MLRFSISSFLSRTAAAIPSTTNRSSPRRRFRARTWPLAIATLGLACAPQGEAPAPAAQAQGVHFEESDAEGYAKTLTSAPRVIPEYAPVGAVLVSSLLLTDPETMEAIAKAILDAGANLVVATDPAFQGGLENPAFDKLKALVGPTHSPLENHISVFANPRGTPLVWTRDSAPLFAKATQGPQAGTPILLDFNYHRKLTQTSGPQDEIADFLPRAFAEASGLSRLSVPVYNEGGNFMINDDGLCIMTDRVLRLNAEARRTDVDPTEKALTESDVRHHFQQAAGCRDILFVKGWSFTTDHIDMWAKFLDNHTLLVATLTQATVDGMEEGPAKETAREVRKYLEERRQEIVRHAPHLRLIESPMAPPQKSPAYDVWAMRGYANSLLVNGTAIVPSWKTQDPVEDARLDPYEQGAAKAYRDAGYTPVFVRALDLLNWGGAIHCVTMQLPEDVRLQGGTAPGPRVR